MKWKTCLKQKRRGREKSQTVSSFHELRNIFGGCLCVFVKVGHCSRSRPENHLDFIYLSFMALGASVMIEFQLLTFVWHNYIKVLYFTSLTQQIYFDCFLLSFAVCLSCFYGPGDQTRQIVLINQSCSMWSRDRLWGCSVLGINTINKNFNPFFKVFNIEQISEDPLRALG